ncbi:hypothetical protein H5410_052580 [Solanum commersonii]|uniref:Uncharacterized protein n=1 Tax=Solanum commersonii TaxID=4109 RepID=A0A9J5X178_SOLCO|nr:hypothetical protein H5410_052580 [Solanum commersonii]
MDEQGVHSPTNAKRSIRSDNKDTLVLIKPVKTHQTRLWSVTLPKVKVKVETTTKKTMLHKKKKHDKIESIIKKTLEQFFQQGQDKHVITPPNPDPNGDRLVPDIEQNRPNTSPRNTNNNITRSNSSGEEDYGEHSYYQDAQNPNADDDSGMSFDSEALHNLDT